jgi:molybdopterin/thiamine biosynthesis adenylyltransferase
MTERARFYEQRDRRTREYLADTIAEQWFERPVAVYVGGDAAGSPRGQLAVLALVNMLARVHRHLCVLCPDNRLLVPHAVLANGSCGHLSLQDALVAQATAIDPFLRLDFTPRILPAAGIAVGGAIDRPVPWYVGFDGSVVQLSAAPVPVDPRDGFSLGACFAACLAAATAFRLVLGRPVATAKVSAWSLEPPRNGDPAPSVLGVLDVGNVLMVGAGAVGSGAAYWLRQTGLGGEWVVVDGDVAELHNTNRSLGLTAADAGWPHNAPRPKAEVTADLIGASAKACWFDELDHDGLCPDLILPLANERGVRSSISQMGQPLLLHATTSRAWEAQLHRHISGLDDCIVCRMPVQASKVRLECSTVSIGSPGASSDAALPFLSATSGLLLVNALYRLMAGELAKDDRNFWRVMFNSVHGLTRSGRCHCLNTCCGILPPGARRRINGGRRWTHLDLGGK